MMLAMDLFVQVSVLKYFVMFIFLVVHSFCACQAGIFCAFFSFFKKYEIRFIIHIFDLVFLSPFFKPLKIDDWWMHLSSVFVSIFTTVRDCEGGFFAILFSLL